MEKKQRGQNMTQVNMLEAKTELSRLVKKLEDHEEDVIYLARNGKPIVQMTLLPPAKAQKRIGIAKGKISVPADFDKWDQDIAELFEESDL